jgi:nifR3 family TIM-barrel protein
VNIYGDNTVNMLGKDQAKFDWKALTPPFSVLAPMEFITDTAFRRLVAFCGKPDVMFSEFTHIEKLCVEGSNTRNRIQFHEEERPLIAQIWGNDPDHTYRAVKALIQLGFDGIDLNMGCPTPRAIEKGGCSALIKNPTLAGELLLAAKEAAGNHVPVSIKTRLGYDRIITEQWAEFLLALQPAALTMHGRLATDMYQGSTHWEEIRKVVALRNAMASDTVIIGNGDVQSSTEILNKHTRYGVEGVMVGRAALKNPLLFRHDEQSLESLTSAQRIQLLWHHATLCRDSLGDTRGFIVIQKYFKIYIAHFEKSAMLRSALSRARSFEQLYDLIKCHIGQDDREFTAHEQTGPED